MCIGGGHELAAAMSCHVMAAAHTRDRPDSCRSPLAVKLLRVPSGGATGAVGGGGLDQIYELRAQAEGGDVAAQARRSGPRTSGRRCVTCDSRPRRVRPSQATVSAPSRGRRATSTLRGRPP